MASYNITSPDGQKYTINAPDDATQDQVLAYAQRSFKMAKAPDQEKSFAARAGQHGGNILAGAIRGAGSIGATIMRPFDTSAENDQRRQSMDDALQTLGAEPESWMYKGGKLGAEIAGTAGAGGLLAKGASMVPGVARVAPGIIESLRTAGMTTGMAPAATTAGKAAIMGTRILGGAANGGASAMMVGDDAGTGAMIGGALPPALAAIGRVGREAAKAIPLVVTPEKQLMARKIAAIAGLTPDDLQAAMRIQGPSMIGTERTVPQILQNPGISQLQRTVINASNNNPLMLREIEQNAQRMAALDRVAPVAGSVNEAADVAGSAIQDFANPLRVETGKRVNQLFESVDPFNESRITLPLEGMENARAKFLGPGTFGTGSRARAGLDEARRIGTEVLPGVDELAAETASNSQTLEKAVRAAGGIRGGSGELRDLGIRQSGTTGLVNNKTGQSADILAEEMHRRGFIPDADPATLFDALRNGGGRKVFANDQVESNGMQRMAEAAMGDAPGAETVMKAIPFREVQSLRSSMNEAWKKASMKGDNKEAAALMGMIKQIDGQVDNVAAGKSLDGDFFPADMVQSWRQALDAHGAKKLRFDTGPQASMFRQGGDGQAAIQGAEIPGKFFSSKLSQIEDAAAFKRLVGDNAQLQNLLKSYATTDAAQQVTKDGALSNAKLSKWMQSRDGAIKNTFSEQEVSTLNQLLQDVQRADGAATLGMSKGSNTAQNIEASKRAIQSGLLDNSVMELLFNKIPGLNQISGPVLKTLREKAAQSKADKLGGLLVDPQELERQLAMLIKGGQPGLLGRAVKSPNAGLLGLSAARALPIALGQ